MNSTNRLAGKIGVVLCGALLACKSPAQPSVSVGVSVSLPAVEIRTESDFYEPLAPEGKWVVIGSYGRCWTPRHVARDWRPYCNGNWERTDAGWYWVSEEPWAWATYHYGRWDYADRYGWYWVPQTQWAPAWVSWHEGGGYIGWAPLYPSGVVIISPRAYVFVQQRQFLEPIRPGIVVVNNTTIINKTVINRGPATAEIERVSGRKIAAVPVRELRHKQEADVITRQPALKAFSEQKAKPAAAPQMRKPDAAMPDAATPVPKNRDTHSEKRQPAPVAPQSKPDPRPDGGNRSPANKDAAEPKADKHAPQMEKPARQTDKNMQPPANDNPPTGEPGGPGQSDQDHGKKSRD